MKKIFPLLFVLIFIFSGCGTTEPFGTTQGVVDGTDGYIFESTSGQDYGLVSCENNAEIVSVQNGQITVPATQQSVPADEGEFRGVWLSYYEIGIQQGGDDEASYRGYIDSLCRSFQPYGITDVFVHVRAYADAIYKSSVYPVSKYAAGIQGGTMYFDCLEIICQVMSSYGIRVHAWVNPYRVHNGTDINELSADNKARQWYRDGSNEDVAVVGEKIYFNPSSEKAQSLVVEGVREILANYPVAGIHIDDYFYPPSCGDFDAVQYNSYLSSGGTMSLDDWRRNNVNSLVLEIYRTVRSFGDDKIFSISPAGNISNNYNSLYADVELWCRGGYADMIIPQIYFGFEHSSHSFASCTAEWLSLRGDGVRMPVGLALYKSGTQDSYAGEGVNEWAENSNIIARQVQHLRNTDSDGFVLFSAEFFDNYGDYPAAELENLKAVI